MEKATYSWSDPNVVLIIDREYLEEDAAGQESGLVDEDGKMDDRTFSLLAEEIREAMLPLLQDAYSAVERQLEKEEYQR